MSRAKDFLLQAGPETALEVLPHVRREGESHLYLRGLVPKDFATLFRRELAGRMIPVFQMPPSALNPDYWEPWSRESAREMSERIGGVVEDTTGPRHRLWRADRVGPGRALREGRGVQPEMHPGPIFVFSGEDFLKLSETLTDPSEPIRFAVPKRTAAEDGENRAEFFRRAAEDLERLEITLPEERILYRNDPDGQAKLLFSDRDLFLKTLGGAIRGFVHRRSGEHVSYISRGTLESLLDLANGKGFLADPVADFVDKDRSLELSLHIGETVWKPRERAPGKEPEWEPPALLYYDRTSGIWALTLL